MTGPIEIAAAPTGTLPADVDTTVRLPVPSDHPHRSRSVTANGTEACLES